MVNYGKHNRNLRTTSAWSADDCEAALVRAEAALPSAAASGAPSSASFAAPPDGASEPAASSAVSPLPAAASVDAAVQADLMAFFGLQDSAWLELSPLAVASDTPVPVARGEPASQTPAAMAVSPLLLSRVSSAALRVACTASTQLLSVGQPLFCRMPSGAVPWWPEGRPWRVCQEGAASLGHLASRRVVHAADAAAARTLLAQRKAPEAQLRQLVTGLETCGLASDPSHLEAGAVVLLLPSSSQEEPSRLAVAGLLDAENGLTLLAEEDLLVRFGQLVP